MDFRESKRLTNLGMVDVMGTQTAKWVNFPGVRWIFGTQVKNERSDEEKKRVQINQNYGIAVRGKIRLYWYSSKGQTVFLASDDSDNMTRVKHSGQTRVNFFDVSFNRGLQLSLTAPPRNLQDCSWD